MNDPLVRKHELALRDLEEQSDYLESHANPRTALRFLRAAERTFEFLARMPLAGEEYSTDIPALAGLRRFRISGFENHIIYYRPAEGAIEVIRIVHGARDARSVLGEQETK